MAIVSSVLMIGDSWLAYGSPFQEVFQLEGFPSLHFHVPEGYGACHSCNVVILVEVCLVGHQGGFYEFECPVLLVVGYDSMPVLHVVYQAFYPSGHPCGACFRVVLFQHDTYFP